MTVVRARSRDRARNLRPHRGVQLLPIATLLSFALLAVGAASRPAHAETGYDLWLRYVRVDDEALRGSYGRSATSLVATSDSPTGRVVVAELQRGLKGLLGAAPAVAKSVTTGGAIVVGTPSTSPVIAALGWKDALARVGPQGYIIRTATIGNHTATVIASSGEAGALYGAYHFLRLMQTRQPIASLDVEQRPRLDRRLLNHWDNLDGSIERGYAGRSLWKWEELPATMDPRVEDYARANASIGINGSVINSVNANPKSLTAPYIEKAAAIANVFRPYGIRVYLAPNFAAPKTIGNLPTADPLDPAVAQWWKDKAAEIYKHIPDFGGFLVKANSEGQPGPQDYKRTHADGANVLADAVKPHGGIVMWRAFVYNADVDPDRVKRAYLELAPLDAKFRDNVFVQVKNGPLDFMPREPFSPLFGAGMKTPLMAELQITQEYLGHSKHLVYLAPMWKEFLEADTYAQGPGTTVAKMTGGIAGVANTGSDRNWTGHDFGQANWYAYGRLAWNSDISSADIADEWIKMTWGHEPELVAAIRGIMLDSREAFVDYTMPLGLHHLIGGDHYAVMPENDDKRRLDWSATYYHRADTSALGFDRTTNGSNGVGQYREPMKSQWNDPKTTPEEFLLWFHRLPWDYRLRSGQTLWDGLVFHYTRGVDEARGIEARWKALAGRVDPERHQAVAARLRTQVEDAIAWREKCLRYFQKFSKRPF